LIQSIVNEAQAHASYAGICIYFNGEAILEDGPDPETTSFMLSLIMEEGTLSVRAVKGYYVYNARKIDGITVICRLYGKGSRIFMKSEEPEYAYTGDTGQDYGILRERARQEAEAFLRSYKEKIIL
jgi:hypothetical protein